jgi:hypothetical protein
MFRLDMELVMVSHEEKCDWHSIINILCCFYFIKGILGWAREKWKSKEVKNRLVEL